MLSGTRTKIHEGQWYKKYFSAPKVLNLLFFILSKVTGSGRILHTGFKRLIFQKGYEILHLNCNYFIFIYKPCTSRLKPYE
jgi:hypothetical protein